MALAMPALAQQAALPASPSYDVPAGALADALAVFAAQAGISVSATPGLLKGQTSPGLSGNFSTSDALARLLSDTRLQATTAGPRSWVLRMSVEVRQTPANDQALAAVTVTAAAERTSVTEHTGSYTAGQTSTATRMGLSLRETPQSVSVITRQQMDDQALTSLPEVMEKTTGITVGRNDSERTTFYSRGYSVQNFQFDGMPNTMDSAAQYTTSLSDSAIYDRVEVVRGATGLLTGAGYPGAVVNLVRKRPTKEFSSSVEAGLGSWGRVRGVADLSAPLTADGRVRGRVVAAAQNAQSHVDYYGRNTRNLYGIVEADLAAMTTASLGIDHMQTRAHGASYGHIPLFLSDGRQTHFPTSFNPATRWSYWNNESTNIFGDFKHFFDNGWKLELAASHLRQSRAVAVGVAAYGVLDPHTGGGINLLAAKIPSDATTHSLNTALSGPFELWGRQHELSLGLSWSQQRRKAPGYTSAFDPVDDYFSWNGHAPRPSFEHQDDRLARITEKGAFGAVRLRPSDSLSVILGTRVSWYRLFDDTRGLDGSYRVSDNLRVDHKTVPYAGLVYDLGGHWSVYASYTNIFNPQTYYKDLAGNALPPLTGKSKEVGVKGEFLDRRLNASLALFHIAQDNAANYQGSRPQTGEEVYVAAKGVRSKGLEFELSGSITPAWNVYGGFTLRQSRAAAQPDVILSAVNTNQPKQLFKLSTSYRMPGEWRQLTVGGSMVWQSATYYQQAGAPYWRATQPSYAVLGLMARYDVDAQLSVSLNINNALNKTYMPGMGSYGTGVYGDPRHVLLTARYQF